MGRPRPDARRPADARHAARLDGRRRVVPVRRRRPRRRPPRARARLARLRRQRHAGRRHLLLPRVPRRPRARPRRAVRAGSARRSTCSATAWAATSRCSTRASGPSRCAASSTSKASACRARSRSQAPGRIAKWLDELKTPMQLRPYADLDAVADRLTKTNPLLRADRAAWLAWHWSRPTGIGDERALLADANHKRMSPLIAQVDDWLECYKRITAPLLWIEGDRSDVSVWWGDRYTKAEFHERLNRRRRRRAPRRRPGRPHAPPRPPRGHRPAARGVPVRIAPSPKRPDLEPHHGRRTHQCHRQPPGRPDEAHGRPPGVSLTTTAKRCA